MLQVEEAAGRLGRAREGDGARCRRRRDHHVRAQLTTVTSCEVATLKVVFVRVPAPGLVIPAMVREAAVLLFTAQDAPAKVMVTTPPVALAVAVQPVNPVPKVTVGVAGTVTFELNVAVMVLPAASLPLGEVVKPMLQVEEALAVWGEPEKETALGAVGVMVTPEAGGIGRGVF